MNDQELKMIGQLLMDVLEECKRKGHGDKLNLELDEDGFTVELLNHRGYRFWFTTSDDVSLEEALLTAYHQLKEG